MSDLPGGVDVGQDHVVRKGEGLHEFREQCLGPGIGVRLEDTPELSVGIMCGCLQGGLYLCGMMGVVVDHRHALEFPFVLKSPVCALKVTESLLGDLQGQMQKICHGKGGQRVLDIVLPVDGETDPVYKDRLPL